MPSAATDPALHSFAVYSPDAAGPLPRGFLQTSPEFAMKRLLAAGSGDIYQFAHAFRAEESGRLHAPEFTLLEWYRLDFDHHRLMDDVRALILEVLPRMHFERISYAELFRDRFDVDPHRATDAELRALTERLGIALGAAAADRSTLLDALFAEAGRGLGAGTGGVFVYDFPVEQAAYARLDGGIPPVAQRFELIADGIEIANGYYEVNDAFEQAARCESENARRAELGLPAVTPDRDLLAALRHGLPECAGVALGFDRLMTLCTGTDRIADVMAFVPYRVE